MASYNNKRSDGLNTLAQQNKGFFSRILRDIGGNWGKDYSDMVMRNAVGVGVNQTPTPVGMDTSNNYDIFSRHAVADLYQKKSISYLDRSYPEKMRILREYSRKEEIRDFITIVADEAIIYDDEDGFCIPIGLGSEFSEDVREAYIKNFKDLYIKWGFGDGIIPWNYFRSFLIDGYIAFEIVYDDKQKDVAGFQMLDPTTLLPGVEPTTGDRIWLQYPEAPEYRRILLDSQVIYLSYSSGSEYQEVSYVEPLIRPYNQLKLLEQSKIMFNVTNAMIYKKFGVPVKGLSRQKQEEQVAKLIADYKEEISWDDDMGTPIINGSPHIPYNKEIWYPKGDGDEMTFEIVKQEGHNLNEDDMLDYFFKKLKRTSKIPMSRFDESNGGGTIFAGLNEMTREEQSMFYFIQRLRTVFKEIVVKPWKIKMILEFPELKNDSNFLNQIDVQFNGVNLFHEWKKLNNLSTRTDILSTMSSSILDEEGKAYIPIEWGIKNILKMDDETIKDIERYRAMSKGGSIDAEPGLSDTGSGSSFGADDFGGSDTKSSSDFGSESSIVDDSGASDFTGSDTETSGETDTEFDF